MPILDQVGGPRKMNNFLFRINHGSDMTENGFKQGFGSNLYTFIHFCPSCFPGQQDGNGKSDTALVQSNSVDCKQGQLWSYAQSLCRNNATKAIALLSQPLVYAYIHIKVSSIFACLEIIQKAVEILPS